MTNPDHKSHGSVTQLIDRFLSGSRDSSDESARQVWEHYLPRLLILARTHLDRRIRVLQDEEDVVHSMGRSFFNRLRRGDFDLAGRDDSLGDAGDHHAKQGPQCDRSPLRGRRDVRRVRRLPPSDANRSETPYEALAPEAAEPTPAEAAVLNEALERRLRDSGRAGAAEVALMRLQGYTNQEIAECSGSCHRSVLSGSQESDHKDGVNDGRREGPSKTEASRR